MPRSRADSDLELSATTPSALTTRGDEPLRIALYSGVWVRHDGISNSLGLKVDLFDRLAGQGCPVSLTIFVQGSDSPDPRVRVHGDLPSLLSDPAFHAADVHMFEFGIAYSLFDALMLLDPAAVTVGVFHNVTPPELAADLGEQRTLERSLRQRHHFAEARHVMCDSEFNRGELVAIGLDADDLSVVHLPYERPVDAAPTTRSEAPDGPVRFIYVGRLVGAKGILELLAAVRQLVRSHAGDFQLALASKRDFADASVADAVERCAADPEMADHLELVWDPDDKRLVEMYRRADALVLPSHHEGFCLPVVEALAHDCFVIASDAGNLPHIVGDCGNCVPVGDHRALADAMSDFVVARRARTGGAADVLPLEGEPTVGEWRRRVDDHLEHYTQHAFERGVLGALVQAIESGSDPVPAWLKRCAQAMATGEEVGAR